MITSITVLLTTSLAFSTAACLSLSVLPSTTAASVSDMVTASSWATPFRSRDLVISAWFCSVSVAPISLNSLPMVYAPVFSFTRPAN